jgi:tripartite-type tricarboxylate transporter receptor subunit TctC
MHNVTDHAAVLSRRCLALLGTVALLFCSPLHSIAAASDQIKIIVGFAAGSGADVITRIVAKRIQIATGRAVIIENKPGAGGRIAADAVVHSDPDGSVILMAPIVTTAFTPFIDKSLDFDALNDLTPITRLGNFKFALAVGKSFPVDNLAEFMAYVKSNPGKISYGTPGAGTPAHFLGAMLNRATGIDLLHVPYRGSGPAAAALLGGEIPSAINTTASMKQLYDDGRIKLLAVTGTKRSPTLPEVPTFGELKMNLGEIENAELWYGFLAPGKTPAALVEELNSIIVDALHDPEVQLHLANLDIEVATDTPESFKKLIKADYDRWGAVIRSTGFTLND